MGQWKCHHVTESHLQFVAMLVSRGTCAAVSHHPSLPRANYSRIKYRRSLIKNGGGPYGWLSRAKRQGCVATTFRRRLRLMLNYENWRAYWVTDCIVPRNLTPIRVTGTHVQRATDWLRDGDCGPLCEWLTRRCRRPLDGAMQLSNAARPLA